MNKKLITTCWRDILCSLQNKGLSIRGGIHTQNTSKYIVKDAFIWKTSEGPFFTVCPEYTGDNNVKHLYTLAFTTKSYIHKNEGNIDDLIYFMKEINNWEEDEPTYEHVNPKQNLLPAEFEE